MPACIANDSGGGYFFHDEPYAGSKTLLFSSDGLTVLTQTCWSNAARKANMRLRVWTRVLPAGSRRKVCRCWTGCPQISHGVDECPE